MKKTKSMIYRPSEESRELTLYAENTGELYRKYVVPAIKMLHKKYVKGTFDTEKSIPVWYNIATEASKMYNREFGYSFSVTDRYTAAYDLAKGYLELIEEGIE